MAKARSLQSNISLFDFMRRHAAFLSCLLLIILVVTAAAFFVIKPDYKAKALIVVEQVGAQDEASQDVDITSYLNKQIEILRSINIARQVVIQLDLATDPEFNPRFRGEVDHRSDDISGFKTLTIYDSILKKMPGLNDAEEFNQAVGIFLEGLEVSSQRDSRIIDVEYRAATGAKAALIANTVVDVYLQRKAAQGFSQTQKLADDLNTRLTLLQNDLRAAKRKYQEYLKISALDPDYDEAAYLARRETLDSAIEDAQKNLAEEEASLEAIRRGQASGSRFRAAKAKENEARKTLATLSERYGDKHPRIIEARKALDVARQDVQKAIAGRVGAQQRVIKDAQVKIETLEGQRLTLEQEKERYQSHGQRMQALEKAIEAKQITLNTFLQTYVSSADAGNPIPLDVRVLSYARVPDSADYSNVVFYTAGGTLCLLLGFLLVPLMAQRFHRTYRNVQKLEADFDLPCNGIIPQGVAASDQDLANIVLSEPSSTLSEAVRNLMMALALNTKQKGAPKVITVTSATSGEGKTMLSIWLARLAAKSGARVLLVDADLRRPSLHTLSSQRTRFSLVDYLTGKKDLAAVIQKNDPSGAHIIYGASVPNSAIDLLAKQKMADLIDNVRKTYDLVVLDSPASGLLSDAPILGKLSDHVIFSVQWDKTSQTIIQTALKRFKNLSISNISFVMMRVDKKRYSLFSNKDLSDFSRKN